MRIDPLRVEIPTHEIERVVSTYKCSEEEAIKALIKAKTAADAAFNETLDTDLTPKSYSIPSIRTYTPREIKAHLDRFVVGQEDYKKRLSIAAAYHFAIVKAMNSADVDKPKLRRFRKKNTLICGPSGSGKTYSAEILGDFLETPTLMIDATDYTEAGYVGKSADDMIRELIQIAPGSTKLEKAEFVEKNGGLIFIDEIDKKAKDGKLIGHDISREGFQRAVLKLIERKHVMVDDPNTPAAQMQDFIDRQRGTNQSSKGSKPKGTISTENILFILGGSFARTIDDLESIVKRRIERGKSSRLEDGSVTIRGFASPANPNKSDGMSNFYKYADSDDYIHFGLIPELVGRAPVKTYANALSKNDLMRIMTETEDSIVEQYRFEFSLFGIDLDIDNEALVWIAKSAENKKTGARALISVFENLLTDFQYELPGRNLKSVTITKDICESPKDALLAILERSPFADFAEKFKSDHGIDIVITPDLEEKIIAYAKQNGMQVSDALDEKLKNISVLNYMDVESPFQISEEVLSSPSYFEDLFVKWKHEQMKGSDDHKKLLP